MREHIRLGLVVEGPSDSLFFKEAHDWRDWINRQGLAQKVIHTNGRSRMIREARQHLHANRSAHRFLGKLQFLAGKETT